MIFWQWVLGKDLERRTKMLGVFAAGLAFFFVLSLVPFVLVVSGLIHVFFGEDVSGPIRELLITVVPADTVPMVERMVDSAEQARHQGMWTMTFVLALWSCGNFMAQLNRSMRYIFDVHNETWAGFFLAVLRVMALMGVWALALLSNALLLVVRPLFQTVTSKLGLERGWALELMDWMSLPFTGGILWVAIFLTLVLTGFGRYRVKFQALGALVSAVGLVGVGWIFSAVLPAFWSQSVVYGALGSIVSVLFWAYVSAWVLLLGAALVVRLQKRLER